MKETDVIKVGTNCELVKQAATEELPEEVMTSRVTFVSDGRNLSITMPMYHGFTTALHEGEIHEIRFQTESKSWWCMCVVTGRREDGSFTLADIRLTTRLQLFTRRRFYRVATTIPVVYYRFNEEQADELRTYYNDGIDLKQAGYLIGLDESKCESGMIIDLSGGGVQIVTREQFEPKDILYVKVKSDFGYADQNLYCKVVESQSVEKHKGTFSVRARFIWINDFQRESIIKHVFNLDRQLLKQRAQGA